MLTNNLDHVEKHFFVKLMNTYTWYFGYVCSVTDCRMKMLNTYKMIKLLIFKYSHKNPDFDCRDIFIFHLIDIIKVSAYRHN